MVDRQSYIYGMLVGCGAGLIVSNVFVVHKGNIASGILFFIFAGLYLLYLNKKNG